MSMRNPLRIFGLVGIAFASLLTMSALFTVPSVAAQETCGDAMKIRAFGGANTRFSKPVNTVGELQAMFERSEQDIRLLLARSGFQGNPDDLFAAVRSGEGVESHSYPPGQRIGWMFFRRGGDPTLRENLCWAGKEAFEGWEIQFSSQGQWYAMAVPKVCGNLSFLNQVTEPVCQVSVNDAAGDTCRDTTMTIDASGSRADTIEVQITTPAGRTQTLTAADSRSANRWEFESDEPKGTFRVAVVGKTPTGRGPTLECRAETTVERNCCVATDPTIGLTAASTNLVPGEETTLTASPQVSECTTIRSVTIDGETVSAPYQMTFSSDTAGTFPVTATVTDALGQTADASVTLTVAPPPVDPRAGRGWTLRPFLGPVSTGDDSVRFDFGDGERRKYATESGFGFGIEAEYRFNPRVGLGLGALIADPGFFLELDIDEDWDMTDEANDMTAVFVGPLFHLTPDRRVDLFVGPLLGWVDYSSVTWNLLGQRVTQDFDGEVTFGVQLGLDIPFRADGPLGLYLGGMYFDSDAETNNPDFELGVDPMMFQVGLSYDFSRRR